MPMTGRRSRRQHRASSYQTGLRLEPKQRLHKAGVSLTVYFPGLHGKMGRETATLIRTHRISIS